MPITTDLYKILGLEKNASKDEIKKAYRILSLKYHPDKNQTKDTTLLFQSINDSYSILYDDNKRREYDSESALFRRCDDSPTSNLFQSQKTAPTSNRPFQEMVFSGENENRNRNIHIVNYPDESSSHFLHSSLNGYHQQPFQHNTFYSQRAHSPHPHPHHPHPPNTHLHPHTHQQSQSSFSVEEPRQILHITIIKDIEITIEQSYNGCDIPIEIVRWIYENNIKKEERETLYISIQKGIDDNEVIELKHKGNVINDQTKGDVKLFVRIKNDTIFTRNGLDLHIKHNVTLKEALCGFSFNLKFINNKVFKINNGAGNIVTPGFKKIIKNMGMTRGDKIGNLIIEFSVEFPTNLTVDQIGSIERIFT